MTFEQVEQKLLALERAFKQHEHTGLDSKAIDVTLEEQDALTEVVGDTVDTTYGNEEVNVINNLVTRVNEIESRLKSIGVLPE